MIYDSAAGSEVLHGENTKDCVQRPSRFNQSLMAIGGSFLPGLLMDQRKSGVDLFKENGRPSLKVDVYFPQFGARKSA
jgi:hypothetical protein